VRYCGCGSLQQEGLERSQMTRALSCPMMVPVAGGIACRATAWVFVSQPAATVTTLPTSQGSLLRRPGYPHELS
jgi:hypothetical protein